MKIILDTSALLSLASGSILEQVVESIHCVVPPRVKLELTGLGKNPDFEGNLARDILDLLDGGIEVAVPSKSSIEGELECAYLANDLIDAEFLITDDTKSIERLEKITRKAVRFSTVLLYALCMKGKLTKKQARHVLERMSVSRNWKDNLIFEQASLLLDQLPE